MMRGGDADESERGFDFLREHADAFVDDLVEAFAKEPDPLLLELIAEARAPKALPVLEEQLDGDDEALRMWAVRGLEMLDTREAERVLAEARADGRLL
jgi:hypothetical protein